MEITNRFTTDEALRRKIAENDPDALRAFTTLRRGIGSDRTVVACWTKPQFSNGQSYPIRNPAALKTVMSGVLEGNCTDLRFYALPPSRVPSTDITYQALFL